MKRPVQSAGQFLEIKIYVSLQFRAIGPPNPARGFIQQNQNARLATAACNQKFPNVRFAAAACTKMYEVCVSAFRYSFARSAHQNQNARLATAACNQKFPNVRFATAACTKMHEICVSLQFRAIEPPNPARGFIQQKQNARFATAACNKKFRHARFVTGTNAKMHETSGRRPRQLAAYKTLSLQYCLNKLSCLIKLFFAKNYCLINSA